MEAPGVAVNSASGLPRLQLKGIPAPGTIAPHRDGGDIAAPTGGVNLPGFIDTSDGANLRTGPAEAGGKTVIDAPLPPATRVFVSGTHPSAPAWWYVTAFLPDKIVRGYVQQLRVNTDLPEPLAKLHEVKSGDTVEKLAVQEYASSVRDGHDLRYYENVLLFANKQRGRVGITGTYQDPGLLGGGANNIQLVAGHRIWLVSPAYAHAVEGAVPDGSLTNGAYAKVERFVQHVVDIIKSVTQSPHYFGEVAGEYAQAIRDHLPEIIGIIAGFIAAEAASAFLAATPTGVGQIAAVLIQLALSAFGAVGMAEAGVEALKHAGQWLTLAWTAKGKDEQLGAASREFLRMLVSIAMAGLAYTGVKGNLGKAVKIAQAMPPAGMVPALAGVGGRSGPMAVAGEGVKLGVPSPAGPLGTAAAMMTKHGDGEGSEPTSAEKAQHSEAKGEKVSSETSTPHEESAISPQSETGGASSASTQVAELRAPARRHWASTVNQKTVAKNMNTVIEPGVDVAADVAEIQSGRVTRVKGNYVVHGRMYGIHDGTLYPISGPGLHQLSRGAFRALGVFNKFGDTPQAYTFLAEMKNVGPAEVEAGLKVWSLLQ
jgi:hypothetical protein